MKPKGKLALSLQAGAALAAVVACASTCGGPPVPPDSEEDARLGSVTPNEDVVNHGNADDPLAQLFNVTDLFDRDRLELHEGGVAAILLEAGWEFTLFNESRVQVALPEGDTVEQTLLMENGTLIGRRRLDVAEEGTPVVVPLPGDRAITVSGTEFFVVLDETTEEAMVGNFEGTVSVTGDGVDLPLPDGVFIREWQPEQSPEAAPQGAIDFTYDDFLEWGHALENPDAFREVVCNDDSEFLADVTIPDSTEVEAGEGFTKRWELLNDGTCTWTDGYLLVFVDGELLSGQDAVALEQVVAPGESVVVGVDMAAPGQPGTYRSWWQLVNEEGEMFGQTPYVDIVVVDETAPLPPELLSPANNASETGENACPPVTLTWLEPPDPGGIAGYFVEVWTEIEGEWTLQTEASSRGTDYEFVTEFCDFEPRLYAWHVAASDIAGNVGPFSDSFFFSLSMKDTIPPAAPLQTSPKDEQDFYGVSCPPVTLEWERPGDASGIAEYRLEVDKFLGGWSPYRALTLEATSYTVIPKSNDCSYTDPTFYRWRVRAYDHAGNPGPYSPYQQFTLSRVIG